MKGISGVYVGPSDLSLSLGKPPTLDPTDKEVLAAIDTIVKTTRKKGLIAGVHTRRAGDGAAPLRGRLPDVHHPQRRAPAGGGRPASHQRGARPGPGGQGEDVLTAAEGALWLILNSGPQLFHVKQLAIGVQY